MDKELRIHINKRTKIITLPLKVRYVSNHGYPNQSFILNKEYNVMGFDGGLSGPTYCIIDEQEQLVSTYCDNFDLNLFEEENYLDRIKSYHKDVA